MQQLLATHLQQQRVHFDGALNAAVDRIAAVEDEVKTTVNEVKATLATATTKAPAPCTPETLTSLASQLAAKQDAALAELK